MADPCIPDLLVAEAHQMLRAQMALLTEINDRLIDLELEKRFPPFWGTREEIDSYRQNSDLERQRIKDRYAVKEGP